MTRKEKESIIKDGNLASSPRTFLRHALLLAFICGLLSWDFFAIGNYTAYPFYYNLGSDSDALYAAQTVTLLNNGGFHIIQHPGATVHSIYGGTYRLLALFSKPYGDLMRLSDMRSKADAYRILTTSVVSGRVIALLLVLVLVCAYYALVFLGVTGSWLIAFAFTLYFATSPAVLYHTHIIRAESLSVLFFLLAVLLYLAGIRAREVPFSYPVIAFLGSGFMSGLAVLSKIQIGPLLAISLIGMIGSLLLSGNMPGFGNIGRKKLLANVGIAYGCVFFTPWWSLQRPAFLTPELVSQMDSDRRRVLGRLPEEFTIEVYLVLIILLALALSIWLLRSRMGKTALERLFRLSLVLNLIAVGVVASVYGVLVPVSVSFDGYLSNTHHLVYSTLTNITGGGFLENAGGSFLSHVTKILALHGNYSPLASLNLLYVVGGAALLCALRCALPMRGGRSRWNYLLPLALFAGAFTMDIFSSMRWIVLYPHYAIYSIGVYGIGLAYLTRLECVADPLKPSHWGTLLGKRVVVVAVFVVQLLMFGHYLYTTPRGASVSKTDLNRSWRHILYKAPQFKKFQ